MTSMVKKAIALVLLASAACARDGASNDAVDQGSAETAAVPAPGQDSATSAETSNAATGRQPGGADAAGSILAWSTPAAGSTVRAPVDELVLHFAPPARLGEVTVTGSEGAMPMMVTAVGEVEHYSLPLSGLGAGTYRVDWKALAAGREHRGSFSFSAR